MLEISKMEPTNTILNRMYLSSLSFNFLIHTELVRSRASRGPRRWYLALRITQITKDELLRELAKGE
jgi:hypothetical protein